LNEEKRTAHLSIRFKQRAVRYLRGLAGFHRKSVSQYVRDALADYVENDLHMISMSMRHNGYSQARIDNEIARMLGDVDDGK
jgi:hypothetical protein